MASLYQGKMAAIYDAMYQTFVDYDEEYAFYNAFIQENNCKTILEIGSGTNWPNDLKKSKIIQVWNIAKV
jgi:hypothetical protein